MKRFFLSFCMLIVAGALWAHNGSLRGSVLDANTRAPLAGALVTLENDNRQTYTDNLGFYQFNDLEAGKYTIRINYLGYDIDTQEATVRDSETSAIAHYLIRGAVELKTVEIAAAPNVQSQVVSALDIHLRPVNTSQDVLRMVPGLFIAQHAGGGKAEQIFLRGFDIDHGTDIAISTDGIPVNMVSHAHGQGYADLHYLIPETVERVNFGKGPYYAPYGNFATAGYVGFQTKNALDRNMIKFQTGMFDTYRALGMFKLIDRQQGNRTHNAYVATDYFFSNNYFDSPQAYNRFSFMGKYNGTVNENTYLTAMVQSFTSSWDASGQIPDRAVDSGQIGFFGAIDDTEGGNTNRTNVSLQLGTQLPDGGLLRNQFYLSHYEFELFSNFTFFLEDPVNGDQIKQKEKRNLFGYNGSYNRKDDWGGLNWETEIGLQIRADDTQNSELSRTKGRQTTLEQLALGDVNEANIGVYLNETVYVTPWLMLNGGLRFDQFYNKYVNKLNPELYDRQIASANIVSPKLNAYFTVNERLQLFVNSGYGFHSNDTRVVVPQNGKEILPKALGYEGGFAWKPVPRVVLTTSVWHLNLEQEFVYVGDAAVVEAGGETRRNGVDFSARAQLLDWLYADLDVNYTNPRALDVPENEDNIPLAPLWTSIGGLSFNTKPGLNGSLRYRYLGDRPANEDNSVVATGYFLMDALVNYTRPKFEVGLSIENLLDERWKEAQFDTESRLFDEPEPSSEIHFTPGTPFNLRAHVAFFF
ncbi:MAG: TonB-dependent receptor [Saprospiraceae bacterium]